MCTYSAITPLVPTTRRPDIYFRHSGCIDITAGLTRTLGLSDGDVINVLPTNTREFILFVSHRAADSVTPAARYRNSVRPTKRGSHNFRCQSKELTDAVNLLTGAHESWLYVGTPIDLAKYGLKGTGLPLILNNQYNKQ